MSRAIDRFRANMDAIYATVGDAGQSSSAQDLDSLVGKILRMTPDGDVPDVNPFPDSLVYSYGHRNSQGLARAADGTMFATATLGIGPCRYIVVDFDRKSQWALQLVGRAHAGPAGQDHRRSDDPGAAVDRAGQSRSHCGDVVPLDASVLQQRVDQRE